MASIPFTPRFPGTNGLINRFPKPWMGSVSVAATVLGVSYCLFRVADPVMRVAPVNRRGTVAEVIQKTRFQTREEVVKEIGKPERVIVEEDRGEPEEMWMYECTDGRVALAMRHGVAHDATFVYTKME